MTELPAEQEAEPALSRGALYLALVATRDLWIHRRVETISFLPDDSTKRRVSYDFTVPLWAGELVDRERIGIPITNMRKELIKNLSVTDAAAKALSVLGREENGELGVEMLEALISGFLGRDLDEAEKSKIKEVVISDVGQDVSAQVSFLRRKLASVANKTELDVLAVTAFIEEFASNFVFIIEVPANYLDRREIVKVSYDKELSDDGDIKNMFSLGREFKVEAPFMPSAASSHLEVNAPEGLQVTFLTHHEVKENDILGDAIGESEARGHNAHLKLPISAYIRTRSIFELRPVFSGLVFQAWLGTFLATIFFGAELLGIKVLYNLLPDIANIGPFAGISLALPAFLLTLLVRSREHGHVHDMLSVPRTVASLTAALLFISAASLVLGLSKSALWGTLQVVETFQALLFVWMSVIAGRIYSNT